MPRSAYASIRGRAALGDLSGGPRPEPAPESAGPPPPAPPTVGAPRETAVGERRVAITPSVLGAITKLGAEVVVEAGAGEAAGFSDAAYAEKGAAVGTRDEAF